MKEYKQDIKTIFQVLGFMAFYLLICLFDSPFLGVFYGFLLLLFWSYKIYDKWSYRRNKYLNEIRFPTQNDSYYKMTSLTFGFLMVSGSFIALFMMDSSMYIPILGLVAGLLVFVNGLLDLPNGQLKINDEKIKLPGQKNEIPISEITSIELSIDKLTITDKENKQVKLDQLE